MPSKARQTSISDSQLQRVIYSLWDFQQALSAVSFITNEFDFNGEYGTHEIRRYRSFEANFIISMARPLEQTRGGTTLSFKAVGMKLTAREKQLCKDVLELRRKVIAHSAEEEMHFRVQTHELSEVGEGLDGLNVPLFRFNEWLLCSEDELLELELFLGRLIQGLGKFLYKLAQSEPDRLNKYKEPDSGRHKRDGGDGAR